MSQEAIQKRAYEIWLENGCTHGHDREDWLQAEAELSANCCQQGCQTVPVAASRTKKAAKTSTPSPKSTKAKK